MARRIAEQFSWVFSRFILVTWWAPGRAACSSRSLRGARSPSSQLRGLLLVPEAIFPAAAKYMRVCIFIFVSYFDFTIRLSLYLKAWAGRSRLPRSRAMRRRSCSPGPRSRLATRQRCLTNWLDSRAHALTILSHTRRSSISGLECVFS